MTTKSSVPFSFYRPFNFPLYCAIFFATFPHFFLLFVPLLAILFDWVHFTCWPLVLLYTTASFKYKNQYRLNVNRGFSFIDSLAQSGPTAIDTGESVREGEKEGEEARHRTECFYFCQKKRTNEFPKRERHMLSVREFVKKG